MASLAVPFITGAALRPDSVSQRLDKAPAQILSHAPWANYTYHPPVSFTIAYSEDAIFLQYRVQEKHIRAVNSMPNSPVYEDSCVEFFIAFDDEPAYYNFEFNCIGANLSGYGTSRTDRKLLPSEAIKQIQYKAILSRDPHSALFNWQLTVVIPFTAFHYHAITSLKGKRAWANFYKCGDALPEPHFVTWSVIEWPEPNFHLRQFFGQLLFTT